MRFAFFLLSLVVFHAMGAEVPELPREFRGAWVASVYNLNWPSRPGLSTDEQREELRAILKKAESLRLNAILLQVRPTSDALYSSQIEPWSSFLTGVSGRAPEPFWDPLAWAVKEAHARGLELHAWFNPFRAATESSGVSAPNHIARTHPLWIRRFGTTSYIDPGIPDAREYVKNVIMDVVRRYDIDGVHIDDYFYPYPVKGRASGFPDGDTYQRYGAGRLSLGDWRRENTNQFVERLYSAIKAEKHWVKFGISPFGIYRPHVPESIEAGVDSYDQLYADSRWWLRQGWCDYMAPQLYWPIDPPAQSFSVLLKWWRDESERSSRRPVWPGLATERIGAKQPASEIVRQVKLSKEPTGGGQIHWDMKCLMNDKGGIVGLLRNDPYATGAAIPAAPWLGQEAPSVPKLNRQGDELRCQSVGTVPARWWALQSRTNGKWSARIFFSSKTTLPVPESADLVAVRALDRFGNVSGPAVLKW